MVQSELTKDESCTYQFEVFNLLPIPNSMQCFAMQLFSRYLNFDMLLVLFLKLKL